MPFVTSKSKSIQGHAPAHNQRGGPASRPFEPSGVGLGQRSKVEGRKQSNKVWSLKKEEVQKEMVESRKVRKKKENEESLKV